LDEIIPIVLLTLCISCGSEQKNDAGITDETETKIEDAGEVEEIVSELIEEDNTEKIIADIVWLWNTILDDAGLSQKDFRRAKFNEYAIYIVNDIKYFQDQDKEYSLPITNDIHWIIASMIYKESSMFSHVIGKMGEVGLLQLNKLARQGYSIKTIKENPRLGLFLGIQWLAISYKACKINNNTWTIEDWAGPLAVFGGGEKKAIIKGKCITNWQYSQDRINLAKIYMKRRVAESL